MENFQFIWKNNNMHLLHWPHCHYVVNIVPSYLQTCPCIMKVFTGHEMRRTGWKDGRTESSNTMVPRAKVVFISLKQSFYCVKQISKY